MAGRVRSLALAVRSPAGPDAEPTRHRSYGSRRSHAATGEADRPMGRTAEATREESRKLIWSRSELHQEKSEEGGAMAGASASSPAPSTALFAGGRVARGCSPKVERWPDQTSGWNVSRGRRTDLEKCHSRGRRLSSQVSPRRRMDEVRGRRRGGNRVHTQRDRAAASQHTQ